MAWGVGRHSHAHTPACIKGNKHRSGNDVLVIPMERGGSSDHHRREANCCCSTSELHRPSASPADFIL